MLKLGSSKPWFDAMEAMTGQRDVLASPLLNYFEPLRVWLEAENAKNNEFIGWEVADSPTTPEDDNNKASSLTGQVAAMIALFVIHAFNFLFRFNL